MNSYSNGYWKEHYHIKAVTVHSSYPCKNQEFTFVADLSNHSIAYSHSKIAALLETKFHDTGSTDTALLALISVVLCFLS